MRPHPLALAALFALALIAGYALVRTGGGPPPLAAFERSPEGVMGTSCRLVAVAPREDAALAERCLDAAEGELRRVEALMSTWIEASEISRLNQAEAGSAVPLSADSLRVLNAARSFHAATGGAFDVTCRPLIELWREAARQERWPSAEAIAAARGASSWEDFILLEDAALKARGSARVDLGGIAKGYGIDRALAALRGAGCPGGLVDVGGDLALSGDSPRPGESWRVDVRHPVEEGTWTELALSEGAVATSGDYARFSTIEGRRVSHIVDPISGLPSERSPAVTVVGPSALEADAWATALSVLGPEALAALPESLEALVATREEGALVGHHTPALPLAGDERPAALRALPRDAASTADGGQGAAGEGRDE